MTGPEFLDDDGGAAEDEELPGADRPATRRGRVLIGLVAAVVLGLGTYAVVRGDDSSRPEARPTPTPVPSRSLVFTSSPCENTSDYGPRCRFYEPPPLAVLVAVRRAFPRATIQTSTSTRLPDGSLATRQLGVNAGLPQVAVDVALGTKSTRFSTTPRGQDDDTLVVLFRTAPDAHHVVTIRVLTDRDHPVDRRTLERLARDPGLLATA